MSQSGLTRITKPAVRRDFLVYDLEWYPGRAALDSKEPVFLSEQGENRGLRLAGIYDGERYSSYTDIDSFLDALFTRENDEKWMYAHYGGMADAVFLLEAIVRRASDNFHVEASFSGSSAIIINVKKGNYTFHLIDSFWLLRDKLAKLGKSVGLNKLGEDYKCSNFPACGHIDHLEAHYFEEGDDPPSLCVFYAPMGELRTYNERDCQILYKAIKQFEELLLGLGGQLQMTIASCAMALFRRKYLGRDIETDAFVNHCARQAYTSSRVEVFQTSCPSDNYLNSLHAKGVRPCPRNCYSVLLDVDQKNWWQYEVCPQCWDYFLKARASYFDFNSSFPYSMTFENPGAAKKNGFRDGMLPRRRDAMYLADVEVSVPPMYLPPLPYRHKNRVFFPVGKWRSWFSNIDLDLLLEHGGRIEKVHSSIEFEKQTYLRDYALDIYDLRKKATSDYEKLILKYLLNSLWGGMRWRPRSHPLPLGAAKALRKVRGVDRKAVDAPQPRRHELSAQGEAPLRGLPELRARSRGTRMQPLHAGAPLPGRVHRDQRGRAPSRARARLGAHHGALSHEPLQAALRREKGCLLL